MKTIVPQIQENQSMPSQKYMKKVKPRHIIIKLLKNRKKRIPRW